MTFYSKVVALASVAALPLAGCATLEHTAVRDEESLLAEAGFEAKPADSPQRLANLGSMPAHKLVLEKKDDRFVYLYADPDYCRCLYVGGPPEYSAYERLVFDEKVAEERLSAAIDWDMWGPWWW